MKKASTNLNILYVIPYFVPAWSYGGPVKVAFDFTKELTRLGHHVTVATTDTIDAKSRSKVAQENIEGVEILRFKNINNFLAKKYNLYSPLGFNNWLKKNINKYDIVHIHEFFTYQSFITSRICKNLNKPYVIQPHGSFSAVSRQSRYFIKKMIIKYLGSVITFSNAVIALNEIEKNNIAKVYPQIKSQIRIVPNGIDLNEFNNIEPINLHRIYNIPTKNKIISFIGRIHKKKGLDISLKALASIRTDTNVTLLIIGPDDGEKNNLLELSIKLGIGNMVVFTGLLSGYKKLQTLKSTDLSLLNSRTEGLPTTLLESTALGLPIVCSRGSNFPEVNKYHAGFVVNNEQQTAQKIKLILEDSKLEKLLSHNSLKLAKSFDIIKCTQLLNKIYESIL